MGSQKMRPVGYLSFTPIVLHLLSCFYFLGVLNPCKSTEASMAKLFVPSQRLRERKRFPA